MKRIIKGKIDMKHFKEQEQEVVKEMPAWAGVLLLCVPITGLIVFLVRCACSTEACSRASILFSILN